MRINKEALAWAAGLFDGEGCTTISNRKTRPSGQIRLVIGMTEIEPLRRFYDAVKIGKIYEGKKVRGKSRKVFHRYEAFGFRRTQAVIALLWNWLSQFKKIQARRCLLEARTWKKRVGQDVHLSKLTDIAVREIKKDLLNYRYGDLRRIAKRYGTTDDMIGLIKNGRTWKHIIVRQNGK